MDIHKRLDKDTVISAHHFEEKTTGIALRMRRSGDQHDNSIAKVKYVDGKPCRVTFKHPLKGDGFQVRGMNVTIVEHKR